ncbi:MAG TPA: CPBP family intramembrane glutamic endopeptidase [Gemmatimonadaceae bacterium]|nr:CPBP family intramembrane glutamic endopeptidase [Gemmatimonadaceae bacterium]
MPSSTVLSRIAPQPASYWQVARAHRYSLLFALPLLLLYEGLAALLSDSHGAGMRNGADVIISSAFYAVGGRYGSALFGLVVIGGSIWLIGRDLRLQRVGGGGGGGALRGRVFAGMFAESLVLALAFGTVVGLVTAQLLGLAPFAAGVQGIASQGPVTKLMLSLGAGLYEELLFRVVLVSGLAWGARTLLGWRPVAAGVAATLVAAVIFSAFHYIGAYGDPFRIDSFVYRAVGGVFFSALYLLRGFGITAWTHALYDVFVLVV